MKATSRHGLLVIAASAVVVAAAAASFHRVSLNGPPAPRTLVASIRAEPQSFNRYVARDLTTVVFTYLAHSSLVRINHATDRLEPELASSWESLDDGRAYRLHLRPRIRFSDGVPFTADDAVFSFEAIYDPRTESPLADTLKVDGKPLLVSAEDARTVLIRFPEPFGPGLRMLDGVPMFPRHVLESSLRSGTFRSAWGPAVSPSGIVGLGPFRLDRYLPGQRLIFERNPYYWKSADGSALPNADQIVLEIVPDQDSEILRLEAGAIDFTESEVRPSAYAALKRAAEARRVSLADVGVGLDGDLFWFNLNPTKADTNRPWLQSADFRRVVAHAIDRDEFVRTVYLGAAVPGYTLVSPGNRLWYANEPAPGYDPAAARRLLAGLDLVDRRHAGVLEDRAGRPVHFTLLTQAGNTSLEIGAAVIRDSLAKVGVRVDVATLEVGALVDRVLSGDYDAAYFRLLTTDTDPSLNADFWLSSGSAHVWNPGQTAPATAWEREIDTLFTQLSTTLDASQRRRLFADVQRVIARELPALCFAYPRLSVAMSTRVTGATPASFRPPVLWNPATIGVAARAH